MNQTKPPRNGVFTNNYPKRVTNDIIKSEKKKTNTNDEHATTTNDEHTNTNDDPTNTNDDPLTPTQKHHQQSSQWHYLMLVTKEKRSSTKRESISTKLFQTPTPPKSKSYTTLKKLGSQLQFTIKDQTKETPTQRWLPRKMSWPAMQLRLHLARRNADSSSAWKLFKLSKVKKYFMYKLPWHFADDQNYLFRRNLISQINDFHKFHGSSNCRKF